MGESKTESEERKLKVQAFARPFNFWYDFYQAYYRESLRLHMEAIEGEFEVVPMSRFHRTLRVMRRVRDAYRLRPLFDQAKLLATAVDALGHKLEGRLRTPSDTFHDGTGQYLMTNASGEQFKVCIDASDYGELRNQDLVAWSDLYFKTNFWPTLPYPTNVFPMVNGDPMILPNLPQFRTYRKAQKKYDLCFIVRIWGDEVESNEHNLRLLEAVALADCKMFLLAYLAGGNVKEYARRLEAQNIPWTTTPMPPQELWSITSESRLNVIRLGVHYCIPWRMTGALAAGTCVVLDRSPLTLWPQPLLNDVHYLDLGVENAPDHSVAEESEYRAIPEKIRGWLSKPEKIEQVALNSADYFDRFLTPERVGAQIIQKVLKLG
jgi:hypothetical protein